MRLSRNIPRGLVRYPQAFTVALAALVVGCDAVVVERHAPLFVTPLSIDGSPVGDAIVDTGGGYEIILREPFGLQITSAIEILAFGGNELVAVTEPFSYKVDEFSSQADFALVGLSVCECNGVGFHFLRKHGLILGLDYSTMQVEFLSRSAIGGDGVTLPFAEPPPQLSGFESAFVDVLVEAEDESRVIRALLDTGTNGTVIREGLFDPSGARSANRVDVQIAREEWGTVAVRAALFDTPGLPDLILGTDVMGAWADRWEFQFAPRGGSVTTVPRLDAEQGTGRLQPAGQGSTRWPSTGY